MVQKSAAFWVTPSRLRRFGLPGQYDAKWFGTRRLWQNTTKGTKSTKAYERPPVIPSLSCSGFIFFAPFVVKHHFQMHDDVR